MSEQNHTRMSNQHHPHYRDGYPGEKARQGQIVLSTRTRQLLFFGLPVLFLAAIVVIALVV